MADNLFDEEEKTIKRAQLLIYTRAEPSVIFEAFTQLLASYQKLFKQFSRLVRINDRQQLELSKKTKDLHVRNSFIKKIFGRYVSDEVVEKILEAPNGLTQSGKSLRVSVMFADLRGFSAISESLPAQSVVEMLNIYLHEMTSIILKHGGTINEFTGDGILVLFGAPSVRHDDPERTIACALEMQLAMKKVNATNQERGFPNLEMGIGIHTGKVIAGNIGSDARTKYTVIGSNVNMAARVETFTVGGQILVTQATLDAISTDLKLAGEFSASFKGIKEPVTMHDVCGIAGNYNLYLPEVSLTYRPLTPSVGTRYQIINGKTSDNTLHAGDLIGVTERHALLTTPDSIEIRTNIKLLICTHDDAESAMYGKVVALREDGEGVQNFV